MVELCRRGRPHSDMRTVIFDLMCKIERMFAGASAVIERSSAVDKPRLRCETKVAQAALVLGGSLKDALR